MLNNAVCNVIASLIFARRFEYEDPYLIRMLKVLEDSLTELSGLIPEVGGSGQATEPLLCSPSSLREAMCQGCEKDLLGVNCRRICLLTSGQGHEGRSGPKSGFLERGRTWAFCLHGRHKTCGYSWGRMLLCSPRAERASKCLLQI